MSSRLHLSEPRSPAAPPGAAARRPLIDLLRFVAAFGIVYAHMGAPGRQAGYTALAVFLILTSFLSLRSWWRGGGPRFWRGRLLRLLLPWLLWSAAFLALQAARDGGIGPVLARLDPWWLLIGGSIHLWFLPFVVVASPLVPLAARTLTTSGRVWAAAALLAPPGLAAVRLHDAGALPEPLAQWAFALVPLLYGLLSAAAQRQGAAGAPALFALATMGTAGLGWGSTIAPYVLGAMLLFEATWRAPTGGPMGAPALDRGLALLGGLAFGIYLLHPALMLAWWKLAPGGPLPLGAVAVFLVSALLAWALWRLPLGRLARPIAGGRARAPRARGAPS